MQYERKLMTLGKFRDFEEVLRRRGFRPALHGEHHYVFEQGNDKVLIHHDGRWRHMQSGDQENWNRVGEGNMVHELHTHLHATGVEEGFGAIYHHYYARPQLHVDSVLVPGSFWDDDQGTMTPEVKRATDHCRIEPPIDPGNGNLPSEEIPDHDLGTIRSATALGQMRLITKIGEEIPMSNWHEKQMQDIMHLRNIHYAGRGTNVQKFRVNENVIVRVKINLNEGVLMAGITGTVRESDGKSYKVDFGKYGLVQLENDIAADCLQPIRKHGISEVMKRSIAAESRIQGDLQIGQRVKDDEGNQYIIERTDTFSRNVYLLNDKGDHLIANVSDVKLCENDMPLVAPPISGTRQTTPAQSGWKVQITGIDPNLNQWRRFAVPANEAEGTIGELGQIEFAYYPIGGSPSHTMYRVLLARGGRRDFADTELSFIES